jgi:hypothetical protein
MLKIFFNRQIILIKRVLEMFSVSAISNSFLNKILLYKRNSSEDSDISAQISDLDASDIVTLSSESLGLLEDFINSTANAPDASAGSLYDVLLSAGNEKLIKNNPVMVNMILTAEETDPSDSSSWIPATEDINLVSMSANEILNIIKKYKEHSGSANTSASLIDTSA